MDGNELLSSGNNESFFDMQMYIIIKKYQFLGNGRAMIRCNEED